MAVLATQGISAQEGRKTASIYASSSVILGKCRSRNGVEQFEHFTQLFTWRF